MTAAKTIAENYIAIWNETDASRRQELIEKCWTEDASYVDPLMAATGHAEIGALVGAVHARFPGFKFALKGEPSGYGRYVRFSWTLGPDGIDAPIEGTDMATVIEGRLKSVTGFLDKVPAAA